MAKAKTAFVCNDCGADFPKWQGQCGECHAWNTLSEIRLSAPASKAAGRSPTRAGYAGTMASVQRLEDVAVVDLPRLGSGFDEFDRVLGGGFVPGSSILIGGHPGAGKSTLLLQTLCLLAEGHPALYVTGEESPEQIAMRANRLGLLTDALQLMAETDVDAILASADALKPKILVVDSIQVIHSETLTSAPGSVSQVRECAAQLTRYAKRTRTVLILVGHVTKEGSLAGPKVLEHMIDCSILLEGEHDSRYRTLRGQKNRFGAVNELGIFAMMDNGMREVTNPSAIFLDRSEHIAPGTTVAVVWEGTRPLLVEIQALVDDSSLGNPRRVTVGFEQNRLAMLLAVLHRHGGIQVGDKDVFANVVGGVRVMETSADLALLLAVVSSLQDKPLPRDWVVFGEVGLSGEIRPVTSGQERLSEAAKHGFKLAIVPKANAPKKAISGLKVIPVTRLSEALEEVQ
ncbi:MAG: DNA repair protein RadA [Pseudomonadota bacterium]|nr:DNA repair protein RadA [Pseudomonadota bacterium]